MLEDGYMKRKKKGRSLFVAAAAFTVVVSAAIPNAAGAAHLTDIQGNTHEKSIQELVEMGLISGYPDNTFKPNKELTRSDVVKLIGKYLVATGYEVPADYKTKMRFSDLTFDSSDELLRYAALVKDAGIFNGSNGKLKANEKMTRENMAVILVNALCAVHQFNYITYVENQNFSKEIFDIYDAKQSAQSAVHVLDYFDITQVRYFKPKDIITRGQFASFLYKITDITVPALSVRSVDVLSENQLFVTLSNQTTHSVKLSEPLKENVKTTVRFNINDIPFTANVTYNVSGFNVEEYDNSPPSVAETNVLRDGNSEYLYITFDKNVAVSDDAKVQMNGEYYVYDTGFEIPPATTARIHPVENEPTAVRILLNELLADIDREDATYYADLTFSGIASEHGVRVSNIEDVQFMRTKDYRFNEGRLEVFSVETSRTTDEIDNSRRIVISFNYPLDRETAMKKSNYSVAGTQLYEVNFNAANPTQVELVLPEGILRNEQASAIKIKNLKAEGSYEVMEDYEGIAYLNETRRPIFKNAKVTSAREVTLTFTEDLGDIESDYFIVRDKDDKKLNVKAYNHSTEREKIIIKVVDNLEKAQDLEIELKPNKDIVDEYGNETEFKRTKVYVPANFWE